jgi:N-acetylmuramic acid 6-phosphate (MurNAc-6-P) etherase
MVAQTDEKTARKLLASSHKNVKIAIVMHKHACSRTQAQKLLKKADGFLAGAL